MFPTELTLTAMQDFRKKPNAKLVLSPIEAFHSGCGQYILTKSGSF